MEAATEDTSKGNTENVLPDSTATEEVAPPVTEGKKSKKEDRTKKDDKNVEQFMKSLNSVPTLEEKLSLVCKKYVQTADDNKKMQFYIKQADKRYVLLMKEKEQLQLEFNKTILVKSKLENLCRELQKQNKVIKESSLHKIREEEERRKETQAKFQSNLAEITSLLEQNDEKNAKLRDDNKNMSERLNSIVQKYQSREQQVDKLVKHMDLESQLAEAKMQKASLEHQAEKERLLAEMEQMKVNMAQYMAKIMEMQGTETSLRGQLGVYTDKYDEFQDALVKSNQMFGGFKEQMEKMSKKIKKLEKESLSWKSRWETSQTALLDMCSERQAGDERAAASARQLAHMQSLCRTLQAERALLLSTLKEHNIERPPLAPAPPPAPPAPAPAPASNSKVDAMAANCAQLRQSLAHLQTQLNTLTNKQKEEQAPKENPKPEKTEKKKSKSKKNKSKNEKSDTPQPESDESNAKDTDEVVPNPTENTVKNSAEKVNDTVSQSSDEIVRNPTETKTDNSAAKVNDIVTKESNEIEPKITENTTENSADDKTLNNLIEAINSTSINVTDLEVDNKVSEVKNLTVTDSNSDTTVKNKDATQSIVTEKDKKDTINKGKDIKDTEVNGKVIESSEIQNMSITESVNDEISCINEVKPIPNEA